MFAYYAQRTNANDYFKVWTGNNHPEAIYTQNFFDTKLNYIHQNPVRAGIVSSPEHYIYSSATNYPDNIGLLEMDFL